ncbi:MAG: (5-formylfuran-3-yl)methyl phosphate synthase [Pseudomonadota bacterium]
MTQFLASVRTPVESQQAIAAGADIIDFKDPGKGALGAVAADVICGCLTVVAGRKTTSATVGDVPMIPTAVAEAVSATAKLGVDIVKLGITSGGSLQACFEALCKTRGAFNARQGLVLVFFADAMADVDPIAAARICGARGVMLDTAHKAQGSLLDVMSLPDIGNFVHQAKDAGLEVGLAGSLRDIHVSPLMSLQPDVMGFRGALCHKGVREEGLDPAACAKIGALITANRPDGAEPASAVLTTAVC